MTKAFLALLRFKMVCGSLSKRPFRALLRLCAPLIYVLNSPSPDISEGSIALLNCHCCWCKLQPEPRQGRSFEENSSAASAAPRKEEASAPVLAERRKNPANALAPPPEGRSWSKTRSENHNFYRHAKNVLISTYKHNAHDYSVYVYGRKIAQVCSPLFTYLTHW